MKPAAGPKPSPTVPSQSLRTESEVAGLAGARYPAADWLRESNLNERFVVMSHARGLVTAPVIPRKLCRGFKLLSGAGVHPAWRDRWSLP
jgi:hypothetical protein